jgi:hypothetical protein
VSPAAGLPLVLAVLSRAGFSSDDLATVAAAAARIPGTHFAGP